MLRQVTEERRASSINHNDILGHLIRNDDSKYHLNDKEIHDQIITILNSGYETVSKTSMMAIKYLHDHPRALQELRVSQIYIILTLIGLEICVIIYATS